MDVTLDSDKLVSNKGRVENFTIAGLWNLFFIKLMKSKKGWLTEM